MESNGVISSQIYSSSQGCKFINFNPGSFQQYEREQQASHFYANICIRPLTCVKGLAKLRRSSIVFLSTPNFNFLQQKWVKIQHYNSCNKTQTRAQVNISTPSTKSNTSNNHNKTPNTSTSTIQIEFGTQTCLTLTQSSNCEVNTFVVREKETVKIDALAIWINLLYH